MEFKLKDYSFAFWQADKMPADMLARYENFVSENAFCTFYQSSSWPKLKKEWQAFFCILENKGVIVASCLMLVRNIGLGQKLAYIPKAPLFSFLTLNSKTSALASESLISTENKEVVKFFLSKIKDLAKKQGCFLLKIDQASLVQSYLYAFRKTEAKDISKISDLTGLSFDLAKIYQELNFKHQEFKKEVGATYQPRFEAIVHKEAWLAYQDKFCQKNLNFANSSFLRSEFLKANEVLANEKLLDDFCTCINSTEQRQGIKLRNKAYFKNIFTSFSDESFLQLVYCDTKALKERLTNEIANLELEINFAKEKFPKKIKGLQEIYEAKIKRLNEIKSIEDKELVAAGNLFLMNNKKEIYLFYSGTLSSLIKFQVQAFSYHKFLNHFLKGEVTRLNLGGLSGNFDDGLTAFKTKFNCHIHEYLGEFDLELSPFKKRMFDFAFWLRKKLKALRKIKN